MKRLLASAALIFTLSACASALESATQEVTVLTPGAHESMCFLDNGALKYRVSPPQTVLITKRPGDLEVRCLADGNRELTVIIEPEHQELALANAFNGFAPGLFIDYHTGAMFAYPHTITVDFSDVPAISMPRPAYDMHLMDNPDLFGMEEFRPGDAALMRDMYYEPTELKKREIPGSAPETGGMIGAQPVAPPVDTGMGGVDKDAPPLNQPPSDMVSDLTRQMNPQVFGAPPGQSVPADDGDGALGNAGPVTLYPIQ